MAIYARSEAAESFASNDPFVLNGAGGARIATYSTRVAGGSLRRGSKVSLDF
jgi:hypothetical protein